MNAHLFNKTTKIATVLFLVSQLGLATAAEPVFLNNAVQLEDLVPVGKHINAEIEDGLGAPSIAAAIQQAMVIDSNNTVYSAYMDKADNKAYVTKLVNNQWLAASPVDVDGDAETVGDVSEQEMTAKEQTAQLFLKNRSLGLAISSNDEPHIAYPTVDGQIMVKKLVLDVNGDATSWESLPSISATGVQYLRLALDSKNAPYVLYGSSVNNLAQLTLVKLEGDSWVVQGNSGDQARETTKVMVQNNVIEAGFALADDVPYIAFDSNQAGLTKNQLYVQKLQNDAWVTVGSRNIHKDVGNIRAVEMTVSNDNVPYVLTESFSHRMAVVKFTGETLEDDWTSIGRGINQNFQTQSFSSIPVDIQIKVDASGTPYIVYQDINSRPESRIRVLRLQPALVDGVLQDIWQEMDISAASLTSADTTTHSHRYNNVVFDKYARPYVVYQDGGTGHDSKSRVLRASVANNSAAMTFSVLENTRFAGQFDLETAELGNVFDDITLSLSGRDKDAFDSAALTQGQLLLKAEAGAQFTVPSYALNVTATNSLNETSGEIPVIVNFIPSEDEDVINARPFAFEVFQCATPCDLTLNEGEEIFFEAIKSKISHFELSGELPEGAKFNLEDPSVGFTGNTSYKSAGVYPITITAFPVDSESDQAPIELSLVIIVENVAMAVEVADYSIIQNEMVDYINAPTVDAAVESFSITGKPGWVGDEGFNGLNGELKGTPSFEDAGEYTGIVSAHGFDGELIEYPFSIIVEQVNLELRDEAEQYLPVAENGPHFENVLFEYAPDVTAAKYFTISGKPGWAVFSPVLGDVTGKPDYTDSGEYSFTITAFGFDNEEPQVTTVNLTVTHTNAPPTIAAVPSLTTIVDIPTMTSDYGTPVSIDVMPYISDVDSAEYGDVARLVRDADAEQLEEGVLPYSHDGSGILEQVANGFIYTPKLGDPEIVTVTFHATDDSTKAVKVNGVIEDKLVITSQSFGIKVQVVKKEYFEQSSSGGSWGWLLFGLISILFGARAAKRNS
ncbi:hypothetical protein RI844_02515 [Thalassotalea fonticola]|uniref:Uncharacterized protein n=1 Tax=Thalassotalea fonticola TaxID=3065649 RepID=A0ABZ0GQA6_9GAMM|nr:hypothetical protein RI844_02515 [Colwelliaceae bacterium S1-1]